MAIRYMPMPAPHPIWGEDGGFPERLQVGFRNGKVRTYWLAEDTAFQPKPHLISQEAFDRLFAENGGYRPKHAKKDR